MPAIGVQPFSSLPSGTPADTSLVPYSDYTAPVARVVQATFDVPTETEDAVSIGGLSGVVTIDFFHDDIGSFRDWLNDNKALIPADTVGAVVGSDIAITFPPGAYSNDVDWASANPGISFAETTPGASATEVIQRAAASDLGGGGAAPTILLAYLDTTVTYNNVDRLADTALSVNVAASGIYEIELVVHSMSAVRALKLDFAGTVTPANFIGTWTGYEMPLTLADPTVGKGAQVTAMGTDFNPGGFDTFNMVFRFTGSLEVTTGGTFLLRGAQTIADASDTTILRGSTLKLTKMN